MDGLGGVGLLSDYRRGARKQAKQEVRVQLILFGVDQALGPKELPQCKLAGSLMGGQDVAVIAGVRLVKVSGDFPLDKDAAEGAGRGEFDPAFEFRNGCLELTECLLVVTTLEVLAHVMGGEQALRLFDGFLQAGRFRGNR